MHKLIKYTLGFVFLLVSVTISAMGGTTPSLNVNLQAQTNGISQEIWVGYIIENLFKNNDFLNTCFDESEFVLDGSVVHIPQAGSKPATTKNRSSFPATTVRRTDTDITYALDVYSTDPTQITNAEQREISYNKMDNVLGEHVSSLKETYADDLLYKWAPTALAYIIRTTGADSAASLSTGATGTRKMLVKENLKQAGALMNKLNIPKSDRYALIPSDMYQELTSDATLMARDGVNGNELSLRDGAILKLYGFSILERSDSVVYTNASTPVPKVPGAATAITDNQSVICYQKNAVAKALGSVKFFEKLNDPQFYGDVYSAECKMGGRKRRSAGEGVVAIVQQP